MKRLLLSFAFCGCATVGPSPTPGAYTCESYCARAIELRCDFARDTGGGAGCVAVCQNVQNKLMRWDLECRSTAESCERINACER